MPSHSSANDCSSPEPSPDDIARDLYLRRGAEDAAARASWNQRGGERDFGGELLNHLRLAPGQRVLDACCGAGAHLVRFAQSVAPGGRAIGVDFSEDAVNKAVEAGCEALVANATALPMFDDGWADAVACAFGIYYLDDIDAALREWRRVLAPGGRLVIAGPAEGTNGELYDFHARATGSGPSDADRLAIGVMGALGERVRAAGFSEVARHTFVNPVHFSTEDFLAYWTQTSLFARTPGAELAQGKALADRGGIPRQITKRVTIVTARIAE